ncbi:MAG TPA: hypothetical protein DD438_09105 [Verrucomicrobiales bacterium]|nr:hypothetical protein [Verrucomicrobiales bacterium]
MKNEAPIEESVVVFAYDFPHRKTQDFLLRLFAEGVRVGHVLAAPPVKLEIPPSSIRAKVRHSAPMPPAKVAAVIGAEYHVVSHGGNEIHDFLDEAQPVVGVIAGARILKSPVIDRFSSGIINFHPGLIPEARGLDALLWSIRKDITLGVTSHLIDSQVDAGRVLERRKIPLFSDDTLFDLSERLYEVQLDMLMEALRRALSGTYEKTDFEGSEYNRKMPPEMEAEIERALPAYLQRRATG